MEYAASIKAIFSNHDIQRKKPTPVSDPEVERRKPKCTLTPLPTISEEDNCDARFQDCNTASLKEGVPTKKPNCTTCKN